MSNPFIFRITGVLKPTYSSQGVVSCNCSIILPVTTAVAASNNINIAIAVYVCNFQPGYTVGRKCTYVKSIPCIINTRRLLDPAQASGSNGTSAG